MKDNTNKPIAIWLYCGALAVIIQIILGGITRLTGSGLSITEWQPLLGSLPPMNKTAWQTSFDKYKEIAQFKVVNAHFTLDNYKAIFFWEWFHRNWARFIGLIFIIPFLIFSIQRKINGKLLLQLTILFLLGLLQAVIGWIMVKSGLNNTMTAVNEVKLAIHFITAIILLCYMLWIAFQLSIRTATHHFSGKLKTSCLISLGLILLQLVFGALMAGSKAALAAPTWPDMNGFIIPSPLSYLLWIQLIHRTLAYLIIIAVFITYKRTTVWKKDHRLVRIRILPLILVLFQVILGIMTLLNILNTNYRYYALFHQGMGIALLIVILLFTYSSGKRDDRLIIT